MLSLEDTIYLLKENPYIKTYLQQSIKAKQQEREQLIQRLRTLLLIPRTIFEKEFIQERIAKAQEPSQLERKQRYWLSLTNRPKFITTIDIEATKQVPIEDLYPLQKQRTTTNKIQALCPLHKDKTPSFTIYKATNTYFCFGCNKGGDNIDFIMHLQNLTFHQALKHIHTST